MKWDERGGQGSFPRLQARIYELRRSVSVHEMNAEAARDGSYEAHHFAYVNALAEVEEIEALLAWHGAWAQRQSWLGWQSWLVSAAALVSVLLSILAMLRL